VGQAFEPVAFYQQHRYSPEVTTGVTHEKTRALFVNTPVGKNIYRCGSRVTGWKARPHLKIIYAASCKTNYIRQNPAKILW